MYVHVIALTQDEHGSKKRGLGLLEKHASGGTRCNLQLGD